jgi:hypothetical protein
MSSPSHQHDAEDAPRGRGLAGPFVNADNIKHDMKAAGFSVADPRVHWGVTIIIDAERPSGGFAYDAAEGIIKLRWTKFPDVSGYQIFRSTQPVIPLLMQNVLTMEARSNSSRADTDDWSDNSVNPNAHHYYYAVLAITKTGSYVLVATGTAVTPQGGEAQSGSHATQSAASRSSGEVTNDEEAERRELRRQEHLSPLTSGMDASDAPNATYGWGWGFNSLGAFTFYAADDHRGEFTHPFEYHKMTDGRYSLVGYVDDDTATALSHRSSKLTVAVYAHRWSGATHIVSLPVDRLSRSQSPRTVTVDGKRNNAIDAEWN